MENVLCCLNSSPQSDDWFWWQSWFTVVGKSRNLFIKPGEKSELEILIKEIVLE